MVELNELSFAFRFGGSMVTNLFTYATKELSQDAFICWLIANHNKEELQEEAYRFLNLLMDEKFLVGDIKAMTIKQQESKMDIVIDFWTESSKNSDSHYLLVLEDKTTSSAHDNQLVNYNDKIDKWNENEVGFEKRTKKVFLKSNILSEQDEKEIANANNKTEIKWRALDIDSLYNGFFKDAKETNSEVLTMYIKYFRKLYNDIKFPPTNEPSLWNYYNWIKFFEDFFKEEYANIYPGSSCQTSIYRGMYPSLLVNYSLVDHEFEATLEIIPRENLVPYLHPGFRYKKNIDGKISDSWVWSINEIDNVYNDEHFKERSNQRLESLREFVVKNGGDLFRYSGSARQFAKIPGDKHIVYKGKTINQLKAELRVWLDAFFNVLSEYRRINNKCTE